MHSAKLLPVVVALAASLVSAKTCTKDILITTASQLIDCDIVDAKITVSEDLVGDLIIDGPKQVKGDIVINNATQLRSVQSNTINAIGGKLSLTSLERLETVQLSSLRTVNSIDLITLPFLTSLAFGTNGVTKASDIRISDTRLNDLSGLKLATVDSLSIDNNDRLVTFNSDLVNITSTLRIVSNGNNMEIKLPNLETVGEIQLENVKSFDVPALSRVSQSLKVNKSPELLSFKANNITFINSSLTFIDNKKLSNVSFPQLTKLGDMTIQNNTALGEVSGFPKLETVGQIILRGDFEKVELPKLDSVIGGVTVTSTTDIEAFCKFFDDAKEDGKIEGEESCSWNNPEANSGGDEGTESNGSSGGGSDSDNKDDDGAAGMVSVNLAMLGLAAFAGIAQLL